jgi:predicted metalloprotease
MKWRPGRRSADIEDRRGAGGRFGGGGLPIPIGRLGGGGIQGRIDPESFTHGTSEQRARWLQTGFDSGKLDSCDTFSGDI